MRTADATMVLGRELALPIFAGAVFGLAVIVSPLAAICALAGGIVAIIMGRDALRSLGVLILVLPFLGTYYVSQNLTSLPGTKPFQLLAVLVAATALWNHHRAQWPPRQVLFFTLAFLMYFTVCVVRALPHIEQMPSSTGEVPTDAKYLLSEYVKPLIFFMPFIIITAFCRKLNDLEQVVRFLAISTAALSVYLLYIYVKDARGLNVREASTIYHDYLAYHRNAIGSLLMVSFPFLLARVSLRRNVFNIGALFATVAATGILYSRTAYVTLAIAPMAYAILSKRFRLVPVIAVSYVVMFLMLPSVVRERALAGLTSSEVNVNEISAGRVEQVWKPVIEEYLANPGNLIFGRGRYGIASTQASLRGQILDVKSAHNMYVEQVFDGGLIGLFFMLAFVAVIFLPFLQSRRRIGDVRLREYWCAVAVSAACFFLGGITGRTMFPSDESSFFWIMAAFAVVIPLIAAADDKPDA